MNWVVIALSAHFLYALAYLLDKFILSTTIRSPLSYTFYVGVLSLPVVLLAPFPFAHFEILTGSALLFALLGGITFSIALLCFYRTLQIGEASRSVPLIGALVPIATLLFSHVFGVSGIEGHYASAFVLLVLGSFFIVAGYKNSDFWRNKNIIILVSAAVFFGLSYTLTKVVFNETNFVSGFIWVRIGSFIVALLLVSRASWRKEIFTTTGTVKPATAGWFFSSKIIGGIATVLQNYAVFLGSVVLVNSMQATQYLFLLLFVSLLSWKFPALFHETIGRSAIFHKIVAIILIGAGLAVLAIPSPVPQPVALGVTFSQKFTEELELDWRKTYQDILDKLQVKDIRLIAYWDKVEPRENEFDFADLDWQVEEARKRNARVLLALGRKSPRWPECHEPRWLKEQNLGQEVYDEKLLKYVTSVAAHYRTSDAIWAWQVENEPLFPFGDCKTQSLRMLKNEVAVVRSVDATRKIVLTDAGELGFAWPVLMPQADIFGTTLYRYVHNRVLGDIKYWFIPPGYFRLKAWIATKIFKKEVLIAELQAEPWSKKSLRDTSLEEQYAGMNPEILREIVSYAKISGFPKAYLWGVEWWYWLKDKKGDSTMWYVAGEVIKKSHVEDK